jgi:hypothetical protein
MSMKDIEKDKDSNSSDEGMVFVCLTDVFTLRRAIGPMMLLGL